jgi:hypothetical protein
LIKRACSVIRIEKPSVGCKAKNNMKALREVRGEEKEGAAKLTWME